MWLLFVRKLKTLKSVKSLSTEKPPETAPPRAPSHFAPIVFTFQKNDFTNKENSKKSPELLDNAFLRLYLCSVDQLTQTFTTEYTKFH